MSGRLVGEVLDHAPIDLPMLDRFVLVALAETAQERDRTARYKSSAEAIADRIGSTPSSVRNALGRLRRRGLIVPQIDRCRRGQSQQWRVVKMTDATRRATFDSATGE